MFAITINQGGLIAGMINKDQLALPEDTSHFVINEGDFETLLALSQHIEKLSQSKNDKDITWRYRVGSHSIDVEAFKKLLAAKGITLTALEAQELQGPATEA